MAGTHGIESGALQQLSLMDFGIVEAGAAEYAVVVVDTRPIDKHRLAIEQESAFGRPSDGPQSDFCRFGIKNYPFIIVQIDSEVVDSRRIRRPQTCILDNQGNRHIYFRMRVYLNLSLHPSGADRNDCHTAYR